MTYVYGYFARKQDADLALVDGFASGTISPYEFVRIYLAFGSMWAIELRA